jgi:uncharacterized protein with ParB-like and HNH nuclease domain
MSELKVSDIGIPELLRRLKRGEWLVREFQREFVWSVSDIIDLIISIFKARPIGDGYPLGAARRVGASP